MLPGCEIPSLTPPPEQDTGRKQDEKCMGQDRGSLMKKATHGNKSKTKKNCSLLLSSRLSPVTSWEAGPQYT